MVMYSMYNETLRLIPYSGHKEPSAGNTSASPSLEQTGAPHPRPIVHNLTAFLLSSPFDGLEVLDPLQSCSRRASHHRDAFIGLKKTIISRIVLQRPWKTYLYLSRERRAGAAYVGQGRANPEAWERTV
ncbi:hypothetical protein BC826DRAFT_979154 [Russula brevipes]|nr:hypothetical protein BC826DRAFT_979154 [Russula brevipes]